VQNNERNCPDITVAFRAAAPPSLVDPFMLVQPQLRPLDASIKELVGADHPVLAAAAHHFFERAGKRFRPTLVLLSSSAAGGGQPADARQVRLAEITEMIHAASLLHDDVIDLADTRRGAKAAHKIYGNKVAVLAGDFLLARSSLLLARMKNTEVQFSSVCLYWLPPRTKSPVPCLLDRRANRTRVLLRVWVIELS
jgi:geranylgeranyl pyrophosphate synthase